MTADSSRPDPQGSSELPRDAGAQETHRLRHSAIKDYPPSARLGDGTIRTPHFEAMIGEIDRLRAVAGAAATAHHSIITPACRINRGDQGAWEEAVARAKAQYDQIVGGWAGREQQPTLHLKLEMERPS